ncbi:ABC transporter substrate-binding protein [Rhodoligotrophos defluvii]|uniref:ABC transporter substrate-binding protein n=1 Tax=Rhodoligotrophos defluvii TaxID=2561934 RepID=UPI0010C97575|nr:ABC transporter substrate-binding protein [Rhodoligotrophos defluvii]
MKPAFSRVMGLSLVLAAALFSPAVAQETVTYATDGGNILDVMKKTLIGPAEQKLGIRVVPDPNADRYPVLKAQVLSGKPTWDVVDFSAGYCARGQQEGLLEPLDYSEIPNAASVPEQFKDEYSVGLSAYATVLAYNTDTYGDNGPKTWADFWDVEKFPGRRALRNYARPTLEIALLADGVAPEDLYPLDVDRAYKKLEEIKPHINVWWTSGAETTQLLFDGEVDMLPLWDGRADTAIQEGAAAKFTRNQAIMEYTCLAVLKGTQHKDAAMKFINALLDPKGQAGWATDYLTGPLNTAFAQHVEPKRLARLTTAPENLKVQVPLNAAWWASEAGANAEKRWLEFMQK